MPPGGLYVRRAGGSVILGFDHYCFWIGAPIGLRNRRQYPPGQRPIEPSLRSFLHVYMCMHTCICMCMHMCVGVQMCVGVHMRMCKGRRVSVHPHMRAMAAILPMARLTMARLTMATLRHFILFTVYTGAMAAIAAAHLAYELLVPRYLLWPHLLTMALLTILTISRASCWCR